MTARDVIALRKAMTALLAKHTGQSPARIARDTLSDCWMTADEARDYGVIDRVASIDEMTALHSERGAQSVRDFGR